MEISGEHLLAAPRAAVWDALNDAEVLRRSLPGCESVTPTAPGAFDVALAMQVGPLRMRFKGDLLMTQAVPPESCVLVFRGQGGALGFAQGTARVALQAVPGQDARTTLSYSAQAQIGGRLAQLGARMIDSVARRSSDEFFAAFQRAIDQPRGVAAAEPLAAAAPAGPASGRPMVPAWWLFIATALGAAAAIAGMLLAR